VTYSTKQTRQLQLTRLEKLKLELLFEEKLLQYETSLEESENQQLEEISKNLEELLEECKACQQSIETMSESIEEKKDELLKVKVCESQRERNPWLSTALIVLCSLFSKLVS
jgi:CHASE3 domain sensor protein